MIDKLLTYQNIKTVLKQKGYTFKAYNNYINIVGVRSKEIKKNRFNDWICVAYLDYNGMECFNKYEATTLPGRNYLLHPINQKGTAILAENQYVDSYRLDFHRGKYLALCQYAGSVAVYRDNDLDDEIDTDGINVEWGFFGINIHRAHNTFLAQWINFYSAGCQVIVDKMDFDEFIQLCEAHQLVHGNRFNYTLVNEMDFLRLI